MSSFKSCERGQGTVFVLLEEKIRLQKAEGLGNVCKQSVLMLRLIPGLQVIKPGWECWLSCLLAVGLWTHYRCFPSLRITETRKRQLNVIPVPMGANIFFYAIYICFIRFVWYSVFKIDTNYESKFLSFYICQCLGFNGTYMLIFRTKNRSNNSARTFLT